MTAIIKQECVESIDIRIPRGDYIRINIAECNFDTARAACAVIKDGGDDPDVTHGAKIIANLELTGIPGQIEIDGGEGVGTVTKPGLGLEINKPAINPVPRNMITENIAEIGGEILQKNGIRTVISVPRGQELALKTDNPRLGILGGISILGTSGIVIPFSTASYAASIRQSLDVTIAAGDKIIILTTGGRSEEFARQIINLPDHCFVQMGDFAGYTVGQCAKKGIEKAVVVGFIGKLAKMAAGVKQTHVKGSKVNMKFLSEMAARCGADDTITARILGANTARHVSEIVKEAGTSGFFEDVCRHVHRHMRDFGSGAVIIEVILFDFDGSILARR